MIVVLYDYKFIIIITINVLYDYKFIIMITSNVLYDNKLQMMVIIIVTIVQRFLLPDSSTNKGRSSNCSNKPGSVWL